MIICYYRYYQYNTINTILEEARVPADFSTAGTHFFGYCYSSLTSTSINTSVARHSYLATALSQPAGAAAPHPGKGRHGRLAVILAFLELAPAVGSSNAVGERMWWLFTACEDCCWKGE